MTPGDRMAPAGYRASSPRSIALAGISLFPGQAKMAHGSGVMERRGCDQLCLNARRRSSSVFSFASARATTFSVSTVLRKASAFFAQWAAKT